MAKKKSDTKETKQEKKTELFSGYGEVGSAKEINLAIEGFRKEGDIASLKAFAKENGFTDDVIDMYLEDTETNPDTEFCDSIMAAIAKLQLEKEFNKDMGIFADDIIDYLTSECDDIALANGIRAKGKRLSEAASRIASEAMNNKIKIPEHTKNTPSGYNEVRYCGPMKGYRLVKEYYTEVSHEANS